MITLRTTLTALVLIAATALGWAQGSTLNVFAQDGDKFFLVLDGERQNAKPLARVSVKNLERPYYKAKVIFDDAKLGTLDQSVQIEGVEPGDHDITYVLRRKTKGGKTYFVMNNYSFTPIKADKKPAVADDQGMAPGADNGGQAAQVNQTATGTDDTFTSSQTVTSPEGESINMGMNVSGMESGNPNVNINMSGTGSGTTTTTRTTTTRTTVTRGRTGTNDEPTPTPKPKPSNPKPNNASTACTAPVADAKLSQMVAQLKGKSFEEERVSTSKLLLKNNCFSTAQIGQLAQTFTFEEGKVAFLKAAYPRCTDKSEYYQLADKLTFSSSKENLTEFLQGQ